MLNKYAQICFKMDLSSPHAIFSKIKDIIVYLNDPSPHSYAFYIQALSTNLNTKNVHDILTLQYLEPFTAMYIFY